MHAQRARVSRQTTLPPNNP